MTDVAEEEIRRADNAQTVLGNDAYLSAWRDIAEEMARQRCKIAVNDKDAAHALVLFEQAMYRFKDVLEAYVRAGQLQRHRLAEVNKKPVLRWPLHA